MTDAMTSQNIYLSSWDILYFCISWLSSASQSIKSYSSNYTSLLPLFKRQEETGAENYTKRRCIIYTSHHILTELSDKKDKMGGHVACMGMMRSAYKILVGRTEGAPATCLLVGLLDFSSTLKVEALCSSETSVATQLTTRRHIPEDNILHNHRCENLKSYKT
jgi:hypothetical protein